MDPTAASVIASAAVNLLGPYLKEVALDVAKRAGTEAGKTAASVAFAKARQVYDLVRGRLEHTPEGTEALDAIARAPDDPAAQEALRGQVERSAQGDDAFAEQLRGMLQQVAATKADVSFVNNIQGDAPKLVQIGTVIGNVTI